MAKTPTKLAWDYDHASGEYRAELRGYRIRQVQEQGAANPFEDREGEWPIAVYSRDGMSGSLTHYPNDIDLLSPIDAFGDTALVFNQHHIAKLFEGSVDSMMADHADVIDMDPVKHCDQGDVLRAVFAEAMAYMDAGSDKFDLCAELWKMSGTHAYSGMTTGYCQGDWAYVLVVATQECIERFGSNPAGIGDDDLKSTVQLYGDWAWGNTYGYVIEQPTAWDEDGEPEAWEEIDACWGFYGDPGPSGLDEAAFEAVPDEPVNAPSPEVILHEMMELA